MLKLQFGYMCREGKGDKKKNSTLAKRRHKNKQQCEWSYSRRDSGSGGACHAKKLVQEGHRLLLCKRYKEDIFAVIAANIWKGDKAETRIETGLHELDPGGSIRVEGKGIVSNRKREEREKAKKIEFLNINTELGWRGKELRTDGRI